MSAAILKPCPFCGGKAELALYPFDLAAAIRCRGKCGIAIWKKGATAGRRVKIAWNQRAAQ